MLLFPSPTILLSQVRLFYFILPLETRFAQNNPIGHESGKVAQFDVKSGEEVNVNQRAHLEQVTDLQMSLDRTYFITSSKDRSAKVCPFGRDIYCTVLTNIHLAPRYQDAGRLETLRDRWTIKQRCDCTFETIRMSPITPQLMLYFVAYFGLVQVLVGGGQEAMNVTTTSSRQGKFETRFWHKIFEEEVGRVKGHFGPINT